MNYDIAKVYQLQKDWVWDNIDCEAPYDGAWGYIMDKIKSVVRRSMIELCGDGR